MGNINDIWLTTYKDSNTHHTVALEIYTSCRMNGPLGLEMLLTSVLDIQHGCRMRIFFIFSTHSS